MPNGQVSDMNANVYNKLDGYVKNSSRNKMIGYTLGGLAVGAGAGVAIGAPTDEMGTALAIGIPCGGVLGFVTSLVTKGVNYKADAGDEVYIYLNEELSIQESL